MQSMKRGSTSLIVVLLALNVAAWGSELLGLGDSRIPEALARENTQIDPNPAIDGGLRDPQSSADRRRHERRLERELAELRLAHEEGRVPLTAPAPQPYRDLITALHDDDIRWNASHALRLLPQCDERILPLLEAALDSPDHQQRQLAAIVLRDRVDQPSERLLEVSLEALRLDDLPMERWMITEGAENAGHATNYLLRHLPKVADRLIANLQSEDPQERFLSAYLLAQGRDTRALQRSCEILIAHLADNCLRGDAALSADALLRLGSVAYPYLVHGEYEADEQALGLLQLIQFDNRRAFDSRAARRERLDLHPRASQLYDPENPADPGLLMGHNPPARWPRDQSGC